MKRIDRHVLTGFIWAFAGSLAFFLGVFLLIHFFNRMGGLSRASLALREAGFTPLEGYLRYYGLYTPFILVEVAPFAALMGAMWTLQQMARQNELVTIVTSGISYRRLVLPIVLLTLASGVLLGFVRESVLPRWQPERDRLDRILRGRKQNVIDELRLRRDGFGRVVSVSRYEVDARVAHHLEITDPDRGDRGFAYAAAARWQDGPEPGWYILDGARRSGFSGPRFPTDVTARDLEIEARGALHLSSQELVELIDRNPHRPRLRVLYHLHLVYPFHGLVLLLIGLPWIFAETRRSPFLSAAASLFLSLAFFAIQRILQDIGSRGDLPPLLAAWLPVLGCALLALVALEVRARR